MSETIINISGSSPSDIVLQYNKNGINVLKKLNSFPPDEFDSAVESGQWINNLYSKKTPNNIWLSELFGLSNRSLWWHWVTWAHETDSMINARIMISLSKRLQSCCSLIKPKFIVYDGTNLWISHIIDAVCAVNNIGYYRPAGKAKSKIKYLNALLKLLRLFARKILWDMNVLRFFQTLPVKKSTQRKRILFCSGDTWSVKNKNDNKSEYQDVHYGSIINGLINNYSITFIQLIPKYKFLLKGILKKIFNETTVYEPFESYLKWSDLILVLIDYLHLKKRWNITSKASNWDFEFLSDRKSNNWWIKNSINFYFSLPVLEHLMCFRIAKNIIQKIKPDYMLVSGEWGCYSLALVIEANDSGIPVDVLQHGFISKAISTNHLSSAVYLREGDMPSPLANYYLLYGDFYKNLLVKYSKIPDERCKVLGSPRFDEFIKNSSLRLDEGRNLLADNGKFVILIAVANLQNGYKYETLKQILEALRGIEEISMVVKIHPEDSEKINEYKLIASSLGVDVAFKLGYGLWDLLIESDLFISEFSTAILESAIVGVETILIDFHSMGYSKYYDNHPFLVSISNTENLRRYIRDRIDNIRKSVSNEDFIKLHLYKIDGKSTSRLIEFIQKRLP